ncbi:hypothetical protein [Pelagicoccus sp. SDUM812002]|uniref:hypothetical protein n=1 Tax=Pelagicoccus sp. SDUM812002 TaxID=3041266 RepID=UPI0028107F71|nr:hypothetical protein [Pelagicoccus sp. SDUM812002]MDQ8187019.1 hypothetical protein [Pelagicoccus sp. SDUM812002]
MPESVVVVVTAAVMVTVAASGVREPNAAVEEMSATDAMYMAYGEGDPGAGMAVVPASIVVAVMARKVVPAVFVEMVSAAFAVYVAVAINAVMTGGVVAMAIVVRTLVVVGVASMITSATVVFVIIEFLANGHLRMDLLVLAASVFEVADHPLALLLSSAIGGGFGTASSFDIDGLGNVTVLLVACFDRMSTARAVTRLGAFAVGLFSAGASECWRANASSRSLGTVRGCYIAAGGVRRGAVLLDAVRPRDRRDGVAPDLRGIGFGTLGPDASLCRGASDGSPGSRSASLGLA